MAEKKEPVYIDITGDTVTIFVHNVIAKQGTIVLTIVLVAFGIFHQYMIENFGGFFVTVAAIFFALLIALGISAMRNHSPIMIMDNERMSFPRVHPEPFAWRDLERIVYRQDHMTLYPTPDSTLAEPITIWIDHRWPFPCVAIRDMMIGKRRKADIRLPLDPDFFITA